MKCPFCHNNLDVYDRDVRFYGNEDIYADCFSCLHSFVFYKRYNKIFSCLVSDLVYDDSLKDYVCVENTERYLKL